MARAARPHGTRRATQLDTANVLQRGDTTPPARLLIRYGRRTGKIFVIHFSHTGHLMTQIDQRRATVGRATRI
jgi:hypothetical protein